jgi:hypothetical protein
MADEQVPDDDRPKPSFWRKVFKQVFDTSPAALFASTIQFFGLLALASIGQRACKFTPETIQRVCSSDSLGNISNTAPALALWAVGITGGLLLFLAVPILWAAIPILAIYLASFLPQPFSGIAVIAGIGLVIYFFYMLGNRLFGGGGSGTPPDLRYRA